MSNHQYSTEYLEDIFYMLKEELGRVPFEGEYPYSNIFSERHGGYSDFVRSLGEEPVNEHVSEEKLKRVFLEMCEKLGEPPTGPKFPYYRTACKLYGTYNGFVKHMNMRPSHIKYKDLTKEVILQDYIESCNKVNRLIMCKELNEMTKYSRALCIKFFGSGANLKEASIASGKLNFSIGRIYPRASNPSKVNGKRTEDNGN